MVQNIAKKLKMGHSRLCPILFMGTGPKGTGPILKILILSALAIACWTWPVMGDLAADYNREGMERMNKGSYYEAITYFEAAHSADPEDANIRKNLSVAYHHLAAEYASNKDWYHAIQNEKLALKNDPRNETVKKQLGIYYNGYGLEYAQKQRHHQAKNYIKEALKYSPDSEVIKTNLYNITLREADSYYKDKNDYKAIILAKEAASYLPDNEAAYIFLGNIYYRQDNFRDSLLYWNNALRINPENKKLQARIAKLKREQKVEADFRTKRRAHFKIRFEREADSEYVWAISDILDDARRKVCSEFDLYPDEVIPVIVYGGKQFQEATVAVDWTIGLYDGKIRLREHDIARGDAILRRTLYHEYGHAFLHLVYGTGIPAWLHEGFAQFNEPEQPLSTADKRFLLSYIERHGDFSVKNLDSMFAKKDQRDMARAAYLESKLFFEYLMKKYRKYKIKRLLEEIKEGRPWQEALREVYSRSIDRLDREFCDYLNGILAS